MNSNDGIKRESERSGLEAEKHIKHRKGSREGNARNQVICKCRATDWATCIQLP